MPLPKAGTLPNGNLEGEEYGATVSIILDESEPGGGPCLHRHPYNETWVVITGTLTFQAGDDHFSVESGDIVLVPFGTPHRFTVSQLSLLP